MRRGYFTQPPQIERVWRDGENVSQRRIRENELYAAWPGQISVSNKTFEIRRENEDRDALIVNDVIKCIAEGRTPVILSRYVDHSRALYDKLRNSADEVFLLSGENSRKEHNAVLQKMKQVKADKRDRCGTVGE